MRLPIADKTQLCVTGIPLPVQASGFSLSLPISILYSVNGVGMVCVCARVCVYKHASSCWHVSVSFAAGVERLTQSVCV